MNSPSTSGEGCYDGGIAVRLRVEASRGRKVFLQMKPKCKSCGDVVWDWDTRSSRLKHEGYKESPGERVYCRECADELFRDKISTARAVIFRPGAGSPGEPSKDDAGPWQSNAIRYMEDG